MEPGSPTERGRRDERDFTEGLPSFADVVLALAAVAQGDPTEAAMEVAQLRVSFPVELEIEADEHGSVTVGGAPPLLRTRTGVMPVFHQLTLRLQGGGGHGG